MPAVFPFPGGKSQLASWILECLPEHECYVEVFGGAAGLLVNKEPSPVEVAAIGGDATVRLSALNAERMGMWTFGERLVDTDGDDELKTLGAPAWAVVVASTGLALCHFREVRVLLSRVATVTKVAAAVLGLLVVASTGLVPGVELTLEPQRLLDRG